MRKVLVKIHNKVAGILTEVDAENYCFEYEKDYKGVPISMTMPVKLEKYEYNFFPPFFDGLLPEGIQLEGLIKKYKVDKNDYMQQLTVTGKDLVGAVTIEAIANKNE